ncbi:unnamed protein product, partial [marine sediment metagenome]
MERLLVLTLWAAMGLAGCTTTVLIDSKPSGAKVYLDNEEVGTTPVKARVKVGTKGSSHTVVLEKDGRRFETHLKNTHLTKTNLVLSVLFFAPALFFTWQPEQDSYTFEMSRYGMSSADPYGPESRKIRPDASSFREPPSLT